jgi:hypothetical protein
MLEREYPYIHAFGLHLGSFKYFRDGEAQAAAADGVPSDVISCKDFAKITQSERDEALRSETDGTAVVLRREGEPYRVWYRVGHIRAEHTRERVTAMAERLQAGKPARGRD